MLYPRSPKELKLTSRHERLLRKLTIDEDGPGTMLHDFGAFLSFIQERDMSQQYP